MSYSRAGEHHRQSATDELSASLAASEARVAALAMWHENSKAAYLAELDRREAAESQAAELRARCEALEAALEKISESRIGGPAVPNMTPEQVWRTARAALLAEPSAQGVGT